MLELNKIYNEDCLKFMAKIPDEYFDLIVTDCPYKIVAGGVCISNPENNPSGCLDKKTEARARAKAKSDGSRIGDKWIKKDGSIPCAVKQGKMFAHNDIEFSEWLPEVYRVLKKGTHCYIMINSRNLKDLQVEAEKVGFEFQNLLVWDKGNKTPNKYYMQQLEFILMLSKRPARNINDMGCGNLITVPNNVGRKTHPSEKPVALIKHLVENSIDKKGIAYDPFAGSGSFCEACEILGVDWVATEIDEEYIKVINKRLKKVQGALF